MIENVDPGLKVAVGMFMLHSYSWDGDKVLSQRLIRSV